MCLCLKVYLCFLSEGTFYHIVSQNGYCWHVDGEIPYRCAKHEVMDLADCENYCTGSPSCVAYHHTVDESYAEGCYLLTSDGYCATGWTILEGPIAHSADEVTVSPHSDPFTCAVKRKTGKIPNLG